ncbi:hypothetical protein CA2559_11523 [Croceibacter atlanticus HTCC2559]|jgi:hypothetical protein|uniref:Uncharacterized protein n=1 Tax=Croceibacter atlanticus (strain ATCC BAA-628 / JCM 21780 / CIP 108009 / IAM 15332 / KCTC 12090 / HTCC2559) TaxID=216432 RepID=A3UA27_CROAH|nr:hypothetical protein CA2559_11523 [Croceibacter atlanticus HTCC2559]
MVLIKYIMNSVIALFSETLNLLVYKDSLAKIFKVEILSKLELTRREFSDKQLVIKNIAIKYYYN